MRNQIKVLIREAIEMNEDEYFEPTISDEIKQHSKACEGRDVIWYGNPERMIRVHRDDVEGMWGNIYYEDKLEDVVNMIKNNEEKVEFETPYAHGDVVDLVEIQEQQTSYQQGGFDVDYEQLNEPYSTGDEYLDEYLGKDEDEIEEVLEGDIENDEIRRFIAMNRTNIARDNKSPDELWEKFKGFDPEEEEVELFKDFVETEDMLKDATKKGYGDIGDFKIQLRDGHHRVMGAIQAGETYVCVDLVEEDIERFKGYYNKV